MIKIRYRDPNELSPGLHAAAECHGRGTTVYLLAGLTAAQRRSALRRLRLSARMGYCPRLPAAKLALALFTGRIRTGVGQTGAIFRSHPAGSTVPVMVVPAGAIAFLLLSTVSIRVLHPPRATDQRLPPSFPAPSVPAIAEPVAGSPSSPVAGGWGRPGSSGSDVGRLIAALAGSGGSAVFIAPTISGFGTDAGSVTAVGVTSTISSGSGSTTGSGNPGSTPTPPPGTTSPSAPASASPSPSPSPSPSAAPSASASASASPSAPASTPSPVAPLPCT